MYVLRIMGGCIITKSLYEGTFKLKWNSEMMILVDILSIAITIWKIME